MPQGQQYVVVDLSGKLPRVLYVGEYGMSREEVERKYPDCMVVSITTAKRAFNRALFVYEYEQASKPA